MPLHDTETKVPTRSNSHERFRSDNELTSDSIYVLHVDDDPGFTKLTRSFLEQNRDAFVVESENDPHRVIERLRSGDVRIDCIVSDYRMPEMDGLELLDAVREHDTELPFILFTGRGSEEIAAEAIASGVTDYLQKGGTEAYSILSNRIENAVESDRRQRTLDRVHEQYQTLIENGSEVVCVHGGDGTVRYINQSVEDVLGIAPDEFIGGDLFEFAHPDDRSRIKSQFSKLRSSDDADETTVQYRCRSAADEWRWIEATWSDERGSSLGGFVLTAREITERVERERELRRQNELFEATQRLAAVGGWEYEPDTETLYWTDEVKQLHGHPPTYEPTLEEAIESYHPEDRPRVRRRIEAALDRGEPFDFEGRIETTGGEMRWVQAYGKPTRSDGSIARLRGAVVDITERKKREQNLQTFRSAVENAGHAIYWTDPDGAIEYVNETFEETTGYGREEVVGESTSILQSGEHADEFYERLWETITDGETWESEITNERKNGDRYTVDQTISPVRDDTGTIRRYVAVNRDITEQKENERRLNALHETTRELLKGDSTDDVAQAAVETARDVLGLSVAGIHLYDANRHALVPAAVTREATELLGEIPAFEPNESVAWDVFERVDPRAYNDIRAAPNAYDRTTDIRSEFLLPLGDHGVFLAGSTEPGAFDERTVSLAKILAANVEAALDRLDRECELRDATERLGTILEHTPDALFVLDDDERIVEANETACASLGYEREELLGTSRSEIGIATDRESTTDGDPLAQLRERPDSVITREGRHVRRDGSEFPVRAKIARVTHDGEGRFLAIARDTSEIEARKRQLRRQNERLDSFAGIVSHDLRNPLTVARAGVELARRTGDGYGETLEKVDRAHDRMETLIEDLLTLARNGEAIDEGDVEPVVFSCVVSRGWDIVSTTDSELYVDGDATVEADRSRLQQLLENLFRNSIEHGRKTQSKTDDGDDGEVPVTVRVGTLPDGFYIADDGNGVPESEQEAIFEPGYSTLEDGTGFGLGIVRDIVDAHGWEIDVTASKTDGARFEITGVELAARE